MAKIDILLPYWGDFGLLKLAVESVMAQTEPNWRLLVIDDCYPSDEAPNYFARISDDRIIYHRHKKNMGITNNFNYALGRAEAEYCIIMGCDDIMLSNYVETALKNIGEADFYQPGVDVINSSGAVYSPLVDRVKRVLRPRKQGIYSGEKLAASLCNGNWLYFPSILWRTEVIKRHGFDARYKIAEDVVLEFKLIMEGRKLYLDKTTTFQYRRFAGSLSSKEKSKNGVRFNEESEVYNDFAQKFKSIGWNRAYRSAKWRITSRLHQLLS